jgi:hypothetical protein
VYNVSYSDSKHLAEEVLCKIVHDSCTNQQYQYVKCSLSLKTIKFHAYISRCLSAVFLFIKQYF